MAGADTRGANPNGPPFFVERGLTPWPPTIRWIAIEETRLWPKENKRGCRPEVEDI